MRKSATAAQQRRNRSVAVTHGVAHKSLPAFMLSTLLVATACTAHARRSAARCDSACFVAAPYPSPSGSRDIIWLASSSYGVFTSAAGEVFRSDDGGASWKVLATGIEGDPTPLVVVGARLLIPYTVASASGDDTLQMVASSDGGRSWSRAPRPPGEIVAMGDTLLAYTARAVMRSNDGGATWRDTVLRYSDSTRDGDMFEEQGLRALDSTIVFLHRESGDYLSRDAGAHWRRIPGPSVDAMDAVAARADTVYSLGPEIAGSRGFRYLTPTLRWATVARIRKGNAYLGTAGIRIIAGEFWVTAGDADTIFHSESAAGPWRGTPAAPDANDLSRVLEHEHVIIAGGESGIFRSSDGGRTWSPSNAGIPDSLFGAAASSAVLAAYSDARVHLLRSGEWTTSASIAATLRADSAVVYDPSVLGMTADSERVFVIAGNTLLRSDAGGPFQRVASFEHLLNPELTPEAVRTPLAVSGSVLLASVIRESRDGEYFGELLRSADGGRSWVSLTDDTLSASAAIPSPDVLAEHDGIFYAGDHTGVFRSTDGLHWSTVAEGLGRGLPVPTTIYPSPGGILVGTVDGGLFHVDTIAGRVQWIRSVATGLAGDVTGLWRSPTAPATIIATTTLGCFWSTDGGQRFSPLLMQRDRSSAGPASALLEWRDTLLAVTPRGLLRVMRTWPE